MSLPKRHKPGSSWRTLAWRPKGDPAPITDGSGDYEEPTEFDELVIDAWFHLEQMGGRHYWMALYREDGTHVAINVSVGERGLLRSIHIKEDG